jgi:hypothetical protein
MRNRVYERALAECRRNPIVSPILQVNDYISIAAITLFTFVLLAASGGLSMYLEAVR